MSEEKELQTIVDRYGIGSYKHETKVIVVNQEDEEKAKAALSSAGVTHRVFVHPYDLADELIAEIVLDKAESSSATLSREPYAVEFCDFKKMADNYVDASLPKIAYLKKGPALEFVEIPKADDDGENNG